MLRIGIRSTTLLLLIQLNDVRMQPSRLHDQVRGWSAAALYACNTAARIHPRLQTRDGREILIVVRSLVSSNKNRHGGAVSIVAVKFVKHMISSSSSSIYQIPNTEHMAYRL